MRNLFISAFAMLAFSASAFAGPTFADIIKDAAKKKDGADTTKTATAEKKKYSDIITKDAVSSHGLMDVHKVKSTFYLEIPDSLMGKPILLATKVSAISDNKDVIAGQIPSNPLLVEWAKDENNVYLLDISRTSTFSATESLQKGFELNYMKPVMKVFPIKTVSADSTSSVIDVTKFFCADEGYMSPFIPSSPFDALFGFNRMKGSFKSDMSAILSGKAFPKNISFKTRMVYTVSSEPFTAIVTVSMIRLADTPMKPRLADHRMGYFRDRHTLYSENLDGSDRYAFINRWNIAPKAEDVERYRRGELVEPEKPIVYYIDDAFPAKWRPYIKEGIEDWQMAFEKIGFKNAIIAKDYPKDDQDFDPDDVRYSCIRYSSTMVANAMGPSWTDPRSGEIIQGSVYFYHDVLRLIHNWKFVQTAAVDPKAREEVFDDQTMGELLRYVIVHEVGHTLGLMHNMRASYAYPVESLRDPEFTSKYGTTPSIMDYARNNYVAQPGDGVTWLLPPRLGVYDCFAIKWGYTPIFEAETPEDEKPVLNSWILEHKDDPMYWYGEQEFLTSVDPASQSESLGDDAVKASEYGIRNLKIIMDNLVEWTAKEGEDYSTTLEMYSEVLKQFNRYMGHVSKYIGGNFLEYPVYGDGKSAFTPVSRAKQKEALEFVMASLKDMPNWLMDKRILSLNDPQNPIIYDYQAAYVRSLIGTISKVGYTSKHAEEPYTQAEYIDDLYRLVFSQSIKGKTPTRAEMNMEYAFIYTVFSNLDLLQKGASKIASLDELKMFSEEVFPCSCPAHAHNHGTHELAEAKRESDLKISGKEIYYGTLLKIKDLMNKRARSSKGEAKDHYSYLAFEINRTLENL